MKIFNPLLVLVLFLLFGCSKSNLVKPTLNQMILGTWEAAYLIENADTFFYGEGLDLTCAYSLVEFTYSSGFSLEEQGKGSIMVCGMHQSSLQWELMDKQLAIRSDSMQTILEVLDWQELWMDVLTEKGFRYRLSRK